MREAAQPPGAHRTEDPTVAMQRVIDQALDLVPSAGALNTQDEAALSRVRGFPDRYAHLASRVPLRSC